MGDSEAPTLATLRMGAASVGGEGDTLASGARVGRYTVEAVVGRGGMGVVYRARDEELDRIVALKMLRKRDDAPEAKARFLREARAMAALSSEHVVQVFDADVYGDDAFIAMEFVEGTTLRLWQDAQPLPARLRAYLAAGHGLLAAHREGLVHRDFKPDNVLVGDDDRVLVTDFGIARALQPTHSAAIDGPITASAEPIDDNEGLTGDGTVMGTPGYMPPEQYRGHPTDARSDQYAFCIALYESLYGKRPFSGRTARDLYATVARGLPPAPEGDPVPRVVRAAIARGVAPSRDARHPSLEPILRALEDATTAPKRRYVWLGLGAAGLLAGVGLGASALAEHEPGCDGARRMAEVWTPAKQEEAARAFEKARPRYGPDTWSRLEPKVDGYARSWSATFDRACASSDELLDTRIACLQERLEVFESLVGVLTTADGAVVEHGARLLSPLESPQSCTRPSQSRIADPEVAARVRSIESKLERVDLLDNAGRFAAALPLAEQALADAEDVGDPIVIAAAHRSLASMHGRVADYVAAREHFEAAAFALRSAGDDGEMVETARELAFLLSARTGDLEAAERWLREGESMLARLDPAERRGRESRFLVAKAALQDARGDLDGSLQTLRRALELLEGTDDASPMELATLHLNLGIALMRAGEYADGREHAREAYDLHVRELGERHPDSLSALDGLSTILLRLGDIEEAGVAARTALEERRAQLGEEHPEVARSYTHYGSVLDAQGRYQEALALYRKSSDIMARTLGESDPTTAASRVNIGLALIHLETGYDEARTVLSSAIDDLRVVLPDSHPFFVFAWSALSRAELGLDRPESALEHADAAVESCTAGHAEPAACAFASFARALALDANGRATEARTMAERAVAELDRAQVGKTADRREVEAWLNRRK